MAWVNRFKMRKSNLLNRYLLSMLQKSFDIVDI